MAALDPKTTPPDTAKHRAPFGTYSQNFPKDKCFDAPAEIFRCLLAKVLLPVNEVNIFIVSSFFSLQQSAIVGIPSSVDP